MSDHGRFEPRRRARRRALQAIYQWQITGQDADEILQQFLAVQNFEKLLRGVSSGRENLDGELQAYLDRPFGQVDQMERVVLRIGAYEMLHCPELPFRVVVDECVDLAHRFGSEQGHAYINAVLDKAARDWRADETDAAASDA